MFFENLKKLVEASTTALKSFWIKVLRNIFDHLRVPLAFITRAETAAIQSEACSNCHPTTVVVLARAAPLGGKALAPQQMYPTLSEFMLKLSRIEDTNSQLCQLTKE